MPSAVQDLLQKLVRINTVNPGLDTNGPGEAALADFVAAYCGERGIATRFQQVTNERRNIMATISGRDADLRLLFVAHMDTVPTTDWESDPFLGDCRENRIHGRGAADTKASLAAMLVALETIRDRTPRSTIVGAGSVDEEHLKLGARLLGTLTPRFAGAIVGDATNLDIVIAHKGWVRFAIEVDGKPAHSSTPERGRNAIVDMAAVIMALQSHGNDLRRRPHPLVGAPSLTVSLIDGGSDICTVPARCRISIDRRLTPDESPGEAIQEIALLLAGLQVKYPGLTARMLPADEDPAFEGAADGRLVRAARAACIPHVGAGTLRGAPYGTDASQLSAAGIPCIVLGPGCIAQAHGPDEYVEVAQLETAVEIYRSIMLNY
jgi:acetylornithine deacetylase/succinyl-diaminopimelate desuccinylase-like protein